VLLLLFYTCNMLCEHNCCVILLSEKEMQYALFLLPYVFQVPPQKGKRPSNEEAGLHFIQFHAVSSSLLQLQHILNLYDTFILF